MCQSDKKASGEVIHEYLYDYDESGNITSIKGIDNSASITQTENATMEYDAANRLIKYNGTEVEYDKDGNMTYGPVDGKMTHMEYDSRNRLVKAGDSIYEYDARNVRTAIQTPEYREEYVTDNEGELSQVLVSERFCSCGDGKYEQEGTVTKYVYGNGLISEETEEKTDKQKTTYVLHHYNNLGSTTELTDATGKVVSKYAYGVYGELKKLVEEIGTTYLYNGKYGVRTDETGLYYMRSRYYNVTIKRFINADTERGSISNGKSLNRYSYVQGNPISYTDPYGLSPISDTGAFVHAMLDVAGLIPILGIGADVANAVLYAKEGDWFNASMCVAGAVGAAVVPGAKLITKCGKLAKYSKTITHTARIIENAAVFTVSAGQAAETAKGMWKKYGEDKQSAGLETLGEVAILGLSVFAAGASAKNICAGGNKLRSLEVKEKIGSKVEESAEVLGKGTKTKNQRLKVNLQFFARKGERKTSTDIYTFGNKTLPRGARPMQDFGVERFDSIVGPEIGPLPKGASNVLNVNDAPLNGHYHMLPAGTEMPDGLDIIADGIDVVPNSPHGEGHLTIFPTREMTVNEFNELFKSLPWQYGGKK